MIDLSKETWAFCWTDSKAHLYLASNGADTRRLCRHHPVLAEHLTTADGRIKCRMCLNIRNLIPNKGKWGVQK